MPESARSTTHTHRLQGTSAGAVAGEEPAEPAELRSRLLRLALLPLGAVALLGAGLAVVVTLALEDGPSWILPASVGAAAVLTLVVAFLAYRSAAATDADLNRRILGVRRSTVETHYKVWQVLDDLQRDLPADQRWSVPLPNPGTSAPTAGEAVHLLAAEARHLRNAAEAIAARGVRPAPASIPVPASAVDAHSRAGIFVHLARRLQSLAHQEIEQLEELENQVEDPDLLKGLFAVDHLALRIRRHAENLAVLGGAVTHHQRSRPVNVYEALRSAIVEVEQYARVKLVRPIDGTLKGHAAADIIHLVAELVENATVFSAPDTQVLVRVGRVSSGLVIEVEDRGQGMEEHERTRCNAMLANPDREDLDELLAEGRIGLYVVSSLAGRHGLTVQLQPNIFGGTQAALTVPEELLGEETPAPKAPAPREIPSEPQPIPVRQPGASTPQPPSVRLRPLPTAGSGHDGGGASQPWVSAPVYAAPAGEAGGRSYANSVSLTSTAELGIVDAPLNGAANGSGGAHAQRDDARPALPKRDKQSHLAPQLRDAPRTLVRGPEPGHDPALMKAFRQGERPDVDPRFPDADDSVSPYRNEER